MNLLYYLESKSCEGGVANVAYYLPKVLAKKINVTYYPQIRSIRNISNLLSVSRDFLLRKFDFIHFNYVPNLINGSYFLLKLAKMMGTPVVLNIHGIIPLEHKISPELGTIKPLDLMIPLKSCQLADKIIANTEFMRKKIAAWYGVDLNKIMVIPNGVDLREFSKNEETITLDGDPAILAVTGYASRIKGFDVLLHAVAKLRLALPNIKLHLLAVKYGECLHLLQELGIEEFVVFHGVVEHSLIPIYYRSADICIIASRHEGFPITLLEAMASGIPVIASNIGSLQEILSDSKDGILFNVEDAEALSKTILTLYHDKDLRKIISNNALKTVANYSWENVAEKYISLYNTLQ